MSVKREGARTGVGMQNKKNLNKKERKKRKGKEKKEEKRAENPGSVASVTVVPGHQTPSSGFLRHCTHSGCIYIHASKIFIHIKVK